MFYYKENVYMGKPTIQIKTKPQIFRNPYLDWGIHYHESIEIAVVHSGTSVLCLEGKEYPLSEGDVAVVFPNQIHSYKNSKSIDVTVMIFLPEILNLYCEKFVSNLPQNPVIRENTEDILTLATMIFPKYYYHSHEEILTELLQAVSVIILSKLELTKRKCEEHKTVNKLVAFCNEHYMEHISLDDVASHLNIGVSRVTDIFRNYLKTTFVQYIQKKRIEYACKLIDTENFNMADISFSAGFNCVRTFNRVFLKEMGMTPKQYALLKRKK